MATIITQTQSRFLKQFAQPDIPRLKQDELKNIKLNETRVGIKKKILVREKIK